jgi:hypothetical protein
MLPLRIFVLLREGRDDGGDENDGLLNGEGSDRDGSERREGSEIKPGPSFLFFLNPCDEMVEQSCQLSGEP